jgi:hypothetical protein
MTSAEPSVVVVRKVSTVLLAVYELKIRLMGNKI